MEQRRWAVLSPALFFPVLSSSSATVSHFLALGGQSRGTRLGDKGVLQ